MKNEFTLTVIDVFRLSTGHTCLVGEVDPKYHKLITSEYICKIILDNSEERELKTLGQDRFIRKPYSSKIERIAIRTTENMEDILQHIGKKSIVVTGYLPD